MKKKFRFNLSQWMRYVLAILVGVLITVGVYGVLPSQASPVLTNGTVYGEEDTLLAQTQTVPTRSTSFVTAAVNRVGIAVVRRHQRTRSLRCRGQHRGRPDAQAASAATTRARRQTPRARLRAAAPTGGAPP